MSRRCPVAVAVAVALGLAAPVSAGALSWQAPLAIPGPDMAPTAVPSPDGVFLVGTDGSVRDVPVGGPVPAVAESLGEPARDGLALVRGASAGSGRDGELVTVYTRLSARPHVYRRVRVVVRAPDGQRTPPLPLSTPGRSADAAQVAVAPDGSALAAWLRHDADGRWHLQYATRPAHGAFRPAVSVPGELAAPPRMTVLGVGAAPGGGGLITWRARRPSRDALGPLLALPIAPDGGARPVLTLADPSAGDSYGVPHDRVSVAYAADRTATLGWVVPKPGVGGDRVVTAVLGRDGQLRDRATLAALGGPAVSWGVAVTSSGAATALWAGYPAFGADAGQATATAWVASRAAGGGWTPPRAVSDPGIHIGAPYPAATPLVADTAGGAVAVWTERTVYASNAQRVLSTGRSPAGVWAPAGDVVLGARAPVVTGLSATGDGHVALNVGLPPAPGQAPGRLLVFGDAAG